MNFRSTIVSILSTAAVLCLGACNISLEQLTVGPPGAVAELDTECDEVRLTRGTAIGIACTKNGGDCDSMTLEVADASIADAFLSYSDDLTNSFDREPVTSFVLVGKTVGETQVTVRSSDGDITLDVLISSP